MRLFDADSRTKNMEFYGKLCTLLFQQCFLIRSQRSLFGRRKLLGREGDPRHHIPKESPWEKQYQCILIKLCVLNQKPKESLWEKQYQWILITLCAAGDPFTQLLPTLLGGVEGQQNLNHRLGPDKAVEHHCFPRGKPWSLLIPAVAVRSRASSPGRRSCRHNPAG